jgi:hypothetical protein
MSCRAWEDLLQRHLDGERSEDLPRHLLDCPHCSPHKADLTRLLAGLARLAPPSVPAGLTDRVTVALVREARTRERSRWRGRVAAFAALAAAAVLAAVGLYSWPRAEKGRPVDGGTPHVQAEPPSPLRDNVALAGGAVVSLTKNTAKDTSEQSSALLSAVKDSTDPLTKVQAPVEPQLDAPVREAAGNVSNGLAPVTDSARRAVGLFMRDLPVGKGDRPAESGE